jgi:hypothetical protein
MADNGGDDGRLRDSEIAIVDTLKLLMEVLVATGTVKASVFEHIFAQQRDSYITKEMPNAAVIMEVLRGFAAKPAAKGDDSLDAPQGNA